MYEFKWVSVCMFVYVPEYSFVSTMYMFEYNFIQCLMKTKEQCERERETERMSSGMNTIAFR